MANSTQSKNEIHRVLGEMNPLETLMSEEADLWKQAVELTLDQGLEPRPLIPETSELAPELAKLPSDGEDPAAELRAVDGLPRGFTIRSSNPAMSWQAQGV